MTRIRVGQDQIRFADEHREVAKTLARLLPEVRQKGQEIAGVAARPVRIVLADSPPRLWAYRWVLFRILQVVLVLSFLPMIPHQPVSDATILALIALGLVALRFLEGYARGYRQLQARVRESWPHIGGLALIYPLRRRALIQVHWPPPVPHPFAQTLTFPLEEQEQYLGHVLAHEYAHVLLRTRQHALRLPPWWDEGFAFRFAEQMVGPRWRPESRIHVQAPEPKHMKSWVQTEWEPYLRLCARYYWEVRSLAEEGRLREVLAAPRKQLDSFRPAAPPVDQPAPRT